MPSATPRSGGSTLRAVGRHDRADAPVEHVQLVDPADPAVARHGSLPLSTVHVRMTRPGTAPVGSRAERSGYPWGSLVASGAVVPFGTDALVELIDPARPRSRGHPGRCQLASAAVFCPDRAVARASPALGVHRRRPLAGDDCGRLTAGQRRLVVLAAAALEEPVAIGGPLAIARRAACSSMGGSSSTPECVSSYRFRRLDLLVGGNPR